MKKELTLKDVQNITAEMLRKINEISENNGLRYYLVCGSVLGAVRHGGPIPWDYDVDITVPLPELQHFCDVMSKNLEGTNYRVVMPGDMSIKDNITTFPRITLRNVNPRLMHIDVFPQIGTAESEDEQTKFQNKLTIVKTRYRDKRMAYSTSGGLARRVKYMLMRFQLRKVDADHELKLFQKLCRKYPYEKSSYVTNPCGRYGVKNVVPKEFFGNPRRIKYLDMLLPVPEMTEEYLMHYYKDYMKYPPQKEIDKMMKYKVRLEEDK